MKVKHLHPWNLTPEKAKAIQNQLASQIRFTNNMPTEVRRVAGVDIFGVDSYGFAAGTVLLDLSDLEIQEIEVARAVPGMPYVPGLLSFREVPVLAQALESLIIYQTLS